MAVGDIDAGETFAQRSLGKAFAAGDRQFANVEQGSDAKRGQCGQEIAWISAFVANGE